MKKFFVTIFTTIFAISSWGQHNPWDETPGALIDDMSRAIASQPGNYIAVSASEFVPRFGLVVQRNAFLELGLGLDFNRLGYIAASEYVSFWYSNLRPYVAGDIMLSSKLLGGIKAGVDYIISTPVVGMAFGGEGTWYTDGRRTAWGVTPKLMLSFVKFEAYYGFDILFHNDLREFIGPHRIGITMTVNPKFWRRKKQIYSNYYDTYIVR